MLLDPSLSFPRLHSSPLQIAYVSPPGRHWIPLTNINSKELQEKTELGAYVPGQQSVAETQIPKNVVNPIVTHPWRRKLLYGTHNINNIVCLSYYIVH